MIVLSMFVSLLFIAIATAIIATGLITNNWPWQYLAFVILFYTKGLRGMVIELRLRSSSPSPEHTYCERY